MHNKGVAGSWKSGKVPSPEDVHIAISVRGLNKAGRWQVAARTSTEQLVVWLDVTWVRLNAS